MFKIGEFSWFTRVSVKMLRHYDRIGLLKPSHVDPESGYRYYSVEQLPRLHRIVALKDLGFSLERIGDLLAGDLSEGQMRALLEQQRADLAALIEAEMVRLVRVEDTLARLADDLPVVDVVLRRVEAQLVASMRQRIDPFSEAISAMFVAVEQYVGAAQADRPPVLLYHDVEFIEEGVDVETAIPLKHPVEPTRRIHVRTLPAVDQMAVLVYTGPYEHMMPALTVLYHWIERGGYRIAGPQRDVYLRYNGSRGPARHLTTNPDDYITEFQIPVKGPNHAL
ncbi:MAG: MerR family transcriptional regulator [Chloroflexi bacterium]|nr:MerR family transcriptional regulator [Chloroflexota bacterium]